MKKFISIFLIIIILFGFIPKTNAETTDNVIFTVDKKMVNVGDKVTITLKTSQKVEAVDFDIKYSNDLMEFESTTLNADFYNPKYSTDTIRVSMYTTSGIDTFSFTFKANKKGNASFSTIIDSLNLDHTGTNKLSFIDKTVSVTIEEKPTNIEVTNITLDKPTASMKVGETLKLTATVKPDDATDKTVTWKSSDTSIATVSNGTVKALKTGIVTITATAGTKSVTCKVTVEEKETVPSIIEVTNITLDKTTASLKVGETLKLTATVKPDNATDKTITWKSSDTSVATVSNGSVKALKEGTVIITANNGNKTVNCKVTVGSKSNTTITGSDGTTAKDPIPQTGERVTILGLAVAVVGIATISIIKYRRYRDI